MLSKLNILPILIILLFIWSCGDKTSNEIIIEETTLENQMIDAYKKGLEALEEGDALFAAKNFNLAENIFPQSIWAPKSIIMSAYAYYSQDYYGDAIYEIERYIAKYPDGEYIAYANYLIGLSYYESIVDEKKDINPILKSKKYFDYIEANHSGSDFAIDANYKILLIKNLLASKELYIARYYLQKEKWIPAINRLKTIVEIYDDTIYVEEAIHRLVEVYYKIGLEEESKRYAKLLGYNYLSSTWYEESYKVFNKSYINPRDQIKKDKKSKIIKTLQSLLE
ncbi:outer membrane protein assembly factor BamD [Candidatus Pelagibacter sp.]|nr:outer membrane protein assembly factor BamD [Candidatus Pelagibacter sp.]